jgi:hypothetical protein
MTVAYFAAAALCFICGRRAYGLRHEAGGREHLLWWCVGTAVLLLGINKQLDLQTLLRDVGRAMSEAEGWYGYRRSVQGWFVAATAIGAVGALILAGSEMRRCWRQHALLYAGVVIIAGFVVIRVATFHHVREAMKWSSPIHNAKYVMEAAGIACIGLSAFSTLRRFSDRTRMRV